MIGFGSSHAGTHVETKTDKHNHVEHKSHGEHKVGHGEHDEHDHDDHHGPTPEDIKNRIVDMLRRFPKTKEKSNVALTSSWSELGMDSFDSVEFSMIFVFDVFQG